MENRQMSAEVAMLSDENPLVRLSAGVTWVQVASELHVSKQAVHEKCAGRGLWGGRQ